MSHYNDGYSKLVAKYQSLLNNADEQEKPKLRAEYQREKLKIRFRQHLEAAGGGIFTHKTRRRIAGILVSSGGRDNTRKDFWFDVRNTVKMALVDLQLFIEAASDDQANQVLTRESLEPIVDGLLWNQISMFPDPTNQDQSKLLKERARIAQLFIESGFRYLSNMKPSMMTSSHNRTMEDALDLSRFLLGCFNP